jgi:hypothetical protein
MNPIRRLTIILILGIISLPVLSQRDTIRPEAPVFEMLSINQLTGNIDMTWSLSSSPDVVGYLVYHYFADPGGGYSTDSIPIVTLMDPTATHCSVNWPFITHRSDSFVIAAIDGSENTSPLSNSLQTIFSESKIDTCNNKITITWNKYSSNPIDVTGYDVLLSVNNGTYYLAGHVSDDVTSYIMDNFQNNAQYCFIIKALLEKGLFSSSNQSCVTVKTKNNPHWINADYATVTADSSIYSLLILLLKLNSSHLKGKPDTLDHFD